ncbi:MAG TPA: hypothetical protein VLE93_02585 [Candidatus Saccharimonadales bacterium]|nr:hypothetical protein [Candidatus Saccharimonadales bacterium]
MALITRLLLILDVICAVISVMAVIGSNGKLNRFWRLFVYFTLAFTVVLMTCIFYQP